MTFVEESLTLELMMFITFWLPKDLIMTKNEKKNRAQRGSI